MCIHSTNTVPKIRTYERKEKTLGKKTSVVRNSEIYLRISGPDALLEALACQPHHKQQRMP